MKEASAWALVNISYTQSPKPPVNRHCIDVCGPWSLLLALARTLNAFCDVQLNLKSSHLWNFVECSCSGQIILIACRSTSVFYVHHIGESVSRKKIEQACAFPEKISSHLHEIFAAQTAAISSRFSAGTVRVLLGSGIPP
ncbi:uncharacterized protein LOC116654584 [Drosophila ananassae]|uniref:uncharacterized protein LOC116654584 n=1 Tax=Drosophila ananassae TaxID=7217 RepID=UPI0013A5E4AD|nr:uncharacterized protein LOC116654584 [Drosophila ananassae]